MEGCWGKENLSVNESERRRDWEGKESMCEGERARERKRVLYTIDSDKERKSCVYE